MKGISLYRLSNRYVLISFSSKYPNTYWAAFLLAEFSEVPAESNRIFDIP